MRLHKALSQNLFLLTQNDSFIRDINRIKRKYSKDINKIKSNRALLIMAIRMIGIDSFRKDLETIYKNIPLRFRPDQRVLSYFVIGIVLNQDTNKLLRDIEQDSKELSPLNPTISISSAAEKVNVKLSFFPTQSKKQIFDYLDSRWNLVQNEVDKHIKKLSGFKKLQPLTNFNRDWKIFSDKNKGKNYPQLEEEYNTYRDNIHRIIMKYRKRIRQLYGT